MKPREDSPELRRAWDELTRCSAFRYLLENPPRLDRTDLDKFVRAIYAGMWMLNKE